MSDTPRTDAVYPPDVIEREYKYQGDSFGWGTLKKMRDCSCQLERELAAMTLEKNLADARLAGIESIYQEKVMELNKIIDQREAQSTRMEGE